MTKTLRLVVGGGFSDAGTAEPAAGSAVPGTPVPEPEPVSEPEPPRGSGAGSGSGTLAAPAARAARGWLSAATSSRHLGGTPHGLAAFIANPRPEPLSVHARHAGNAIRAAVNPENDQRAAEAGKAAYHILVAIPLKTIAKTIRRGADFLDCAPDAPHVLIGAAVILGVIAAMFLLI